MAKSHIHKKGISGVVTAVLMITLVLAATAIVWGIVNNTLNKQISNSESCFGNFEKVTINPVYTCYDSSAGEVHFSLSIGDIEVDEVVVSISSAGGTTPYTIAGTDPGNTGLTLYLSGGDVILPGINSGLTYVASVSAKPDLIKIAPVLNGQQCEISDTISGIESCSLSG